jgi:hypothetical protein
MFGAWTLRQRRVTLKSGVAIVPRPDLQRDPTMLSTLPNRQVRTSLVAAAAAAAAFAWQPASSAPTACDEFSELRMTLEQNATDGDTEVVLFAKGQDEGLRRLKITAPNGRVITTLRGAGKRRSIGLREFNLESAEPPDLAAVLRSFPEGLYGFSGRTVSGGCLQGQAALSHQIAPATILLIPAENQVVALGQLVLSWAAVAGAERYVVELNNESNGAEMKLDVFPPTTSLAIGPPLLQAGSEYQFAVGVRMPNGNITFVERVFFTAP